MFCYIGLIVTMLRRYYSPQYKSINYIQLMAIKIRPRCNIPIFYLTSVTDQVFNQVS